MDVGVLQGTSISFRSIYNRGYRGRTELCLLFTRGYEKCEAFSIILIMKNKIKNKRFTTLESAQKYANKHYAKEVANEFSTLEIKWEDYNEYNNQIYPTFRPSASTIMPWVSTIPLEDKSGYYFYARNYWNYHSSKREKLGVHAEREEVKRMAEEWYKKTLFSVFYE